LKKEKKSMNKTKAAFIVEANGWGIDPVTAARAFDGSTSPLRKEEVSQIDEALPSATKRLAKALNLSAAKFLGKVEAGEIPLAVLTKLSAQSVEVQRQN
jgi:hypothetical protein